MSDVLLPDDLWRPTRWGYTYPSPAASKLWVVLAVLVLVIGYNPVGNEALPAWAYVPVNVVVGAALLALARWSGLSLSLIHI